MPRPLPAPAARGRPPARRPPTIAQGVGSCAVPETFPGAFAAAVCARERRAGRPRLCARPGPSGGADPSEGGASGSARGCPQQGLLRPTPGHAEVRALGGRSRAVPWGRRPAPRRRPRSGTGTTWTAASPDTASASPSACGSAPPPAGSPPTRCNGDRDRAAPGWGPGLLRREWGATLPLTQSRKPRGKGAERNEAGGNIVPGSKRTFCGRLKSDTSFWIPCTGRLGCEPAGGGRAVQFMGPWTGSWEFWILCQPFPIELPCGLGNYKTSEPHFPHVNGDY